MSKRIVLSACLTALLLLVLNVQLVLAHAELVDSDPKPNAVLPQSPAQIELIFSEPLESQLSTIRIYDGNGTAVDTGEVSVDPTNRERMTVSLPTLPDGIYTVSWQAFSQTDGHASAGSFSFAVGNAAASNLPAEQETTSSTLSVSALIAKWLLLASLALLAGQYPSKFFVWEPARNLDGDADLFQRLSLTWDKLYRIGLIGSLLACGLGVLSQAGQATGHELAAPWAKETIQVLMETRLGVIWLARVALALTGLWMLRDPSASWKQQARFIVGLALLLTVSLTSHAATELHPLLPVFADWLHLTGMAFWFGGLVHLISGLVILRNVEDPLRTRITASVTRRFSTMALPSVGVLGLTGLYSAVLRVGSIPALFDTLYGDSLLVKQVFFAALLLIAAINLLVISPGLNRDALQNIPDSPSVRRFGRTVRVEIILACLLLGSVSVMTYLPPARTPPPQTTLTAARTVDDIRVALSISPGLVGSNTFTVQLSPARSIQTVKAVSLSLVTVDVNVPPSDLPLNDQGNGSFTADGSNIGFPGRWLVEVTVQRENSFDAVVTFDFNVPKPGSANANDDTGLLWISRGLIALILLLIGLNI